MYCTLSRLLIVLILVLSSLAPTYAQGSVEKIAYGTALTDYLNEDETRRWSFGGRAGDVIVADVIVPLNSQLDPRLQLISPDNRLLAEDDDSGNQTNARLVPFTLPMTGQYQLVVAGYAGQGSFTLQLDTLETMTPLSLEKPLEISLDERRKIHYLLYQTQADATLRLTAQSDSQTDAPLLTVYHPDGRRMTNSVLSEAGVLDPFIVEADAHYIVALERAFPQDSEAHRYAVRLQRSAVKLLVDGMSLEGDFAGGLDSHYFAAQAGARVSLHLRRLTGAVSPAMYVRSIGGERVLFSSTGSAVDDLTVNLMIPDAGIYAIEISDTAYQGAQGRYQLRFQME